jgi:hypothetical protein
MVMLFDDSDVLVEAEDGTGKEERLQVHTGSVPVCTQMFLQLLS